jgi:hypothetical protein
MSVQEYRNWRPTYSSYNITFPEDGPPIREVFHDEFRQFLALSGLSCEASEAQSVMHKAFRKGVKPDYSKVKDELSDVWWYFNMCLDEFNLTLEELSAYNKEKLDARNS